MVSVHIYGDCIQIFKLKPAKLTESVKACPWDKMSNSHKNTYLCLPRLIFLI